MDEERIHKFLDRVVVFAPVTLINSVLYWLVQFFLKK